MEHMVYIVPLVAKHVHHFAHILNPETSKIKRVGLIIGAAYSAWKMAMEVKRRYTKAQWDERSQDKVILHQFPRGKISPHISPFCLKLETYLRMANIPYEVDFTDVWGPKGKTPYITVEGEEIGDSQLCIQFLNQKFEKDMSSELTEEQRALAHAMQVMVDEHLVWALIVWRFSVNKAACFNIIQHTPGFVKFFVKIFYPQKIKNRAYQQGMGRYSPQEIDEIASKDLRSISTILGKKQFLFGDEPCETDCAVFAQLVQILWNSPGSNFVQLCDGELPNLREYCLRMKQRYWQDWEECFYTG